MVNTLPTNSFIIKCPALGWFPPQSGDENAHTRLIPSKIWKLSDLQEVAKKQLLLNGDENDVLLPVTNDCQDDIQNFELTHEDIANLILDLRDEDYRNSQWCQKSVRPGVKVHPDQMWVPCDAYAMNTVETDKRGNEIRREYYLKMSLTPTGGVVLLISLHPSTYKKHG